MTAITRRDTLTELLLWFGLAGGGLAWGAHLGVGYTLVTLPCIVDVQSTRAELHVLTVATALVAFAAVAVSAYLLRRSGARLTGDMGESGGRRGFMAAGGIMLSGISFIAIIVESFALPFARLCS